jgi:hypothetical protein
MSGIYFLILKIKIKRKITKKGEKVDKFKLQVEQFRIEVY